VARAREVHLLSPKKTTGRWTTDAPAGRVPVVLEGRDDASSVVVLAPGAGAGFRHEFMSTIADGLTSSGLMVCRFNFVYAERGRRAPDRQPVLEDTYRAVLEDVERRIGERRLFIGGKSMGGRIATHLVAAGFDAAGVVLLGYPLHPPGKPDRVRAAHLYDIKVPMLFVEGTRDPFCPLATLEEVRQDIPGPTEVAVIEDADHSFKVRKSSGRSTADAWTEVVAAVSAWVRRIETDG